MTPNDWQKFRQARNTYIYYFRNAKANYNSRMANKLAQPTGISPKMWCKLSKQFLGKITDTDIPSLVDNDKLITDTSDKCEIFNNFFSSISTIDDMNAGLPDMVFHTGQRLSNVSVSEQDVLNQLLSLDLTKALGPNNSSPYLLKMSAPVLAPH